MLNISDSAFNSSNSVADCDWLPGNPMSDKSSSDSESSESDDQVLCAIFQHLAVDHEESQDEGVQGSTNNCCSNYTRLQ